ncbi:MAG: pyridoxal-phosphate dependent enzyme [Deltaproteobacteria bacterium]|nr:pyridoxal-phosphate dependent enzyme [Deltaproteobacteria bacterium]
MSERPLPSLEDVRAAARRIAPHIHRTPVMRSRTLDAMANASLYFKCENLQRVGAFKMRGATNAIFSLSDAVARRGVATHSSGNHAQAVALAAKLRGVDAHVVMPEDAPEVKRAAAESYGARIVTCASNLRAREQTLAEVVEATGATPIHPYDDARVIAGQGTAALELLEQEPELDVLIAPVGGGGLLSGSALAASSQGGALRVIGAEPAAADDAFRSLESGQRQPSLDPVTLADGLRTALGELPFRILREHDVRIRLVDEPEIVGAMRLVWERMKLLIEPSAAVAVATALFDAEAGLAGMRVGVLLSGGNVELEALPFGSSLRA